MERPRAVVAGVAVAALALALLLRRRARQRELPAAVREEYRLSHDGFVRARLHTPSAGEICIRAFTSRGMPTPRRP